MHSATCEAASENTTTFPTAPVERYRDANVWAELDAQARPADREDHKAALEKKKQASEKRDAALRAAMKEFNAKVEALAARRWRRRGVRRVDGVLGRSTSSDYP